METLSSFIDAPEDQIIADASCTPDSKPSQGNIHRGGDGDATTCLPGEGSDVTEPECDTEKETPFCCDRFGFSAINGHGRYNREFCYPCK